MAQVFFLTLLLAISYSLPLRSQTLDLDQSSASVEWERIGNDYVDLIYPTSMKRESVYIANLIEHYSEVVGASLKIKKPLLFTLVLRPEVAQPNGFVALMPRRSEWFASSAYSTYVGSTEWYQTLSIHEYRHVMQFDHLDRGLVSVANYLFGDFGKSFAIFAGVPPWYFEGDAVWAETKYTDAGRGRSPIFLSRLKALLLSDQIPTYDEFIGGTYKTSLPNHYVYGYVLISNATKRFGEDFWTKVMEKVASIPHPYRIFSAFKAISGVEFEDFYNQTLSELKKDWGMNFQTKMAKVDYRENLYPIPVDGGLVYLRESLDDYTQVLKRTGGESHVVTEIPFASSVQQFHASRSSAVYSEFHPDSRYGYRGTSVVYHIDLETGHREQVVSGARLYSPRLNQDASRFIAVNFTSEQNWVLDEYDLRGEPKRRVVIKDHKFSEATYLNPNQAVAILNDSRGYKQLALVNLSDSKAKSLLAASRNNLHALSTDSKGNIYFEAQYKGKVQVFKTDLTGKFYQCTQTEIAALTPSSDGTALYYSEIDGYGSHIAKTSSAKCQEIAARELTDFNYLGSDPSDNYNNFEPVKLDNQKELYAKNESKYKPESYGDIDKRLFIPHSWSFFGGRGFQIGVTTDNYLRTMGINAAIGVDSEENETFGEFELDYKRYYPVFSFLGSLRERSVDIYNYPNDLEWNEKLAGLKVTLPYLARRGLYNFAHKVSASASYLDASDYNETNVNRKTPDRFFYVYSAGASFSIAKDLRYRSLISPWAIKLEARYDDAHNTKLGAYSGARLYSGGQVQVPGFFHHDGFFATFDREVQRDSRVAYQFTPWKADTLGYVFSRGYSYDAVSEYRKGTANYIFPIALSDLNIWGLYYLRRIFGTFFYDYTHTQSLGMREVLKSYGAQIEFESKFFRVLPLNWGTRFIQRERDSKFISEFYFGTDLSY